jgi:hypothetical protein
MKKKKKELSVNHITIIKIVNFGIKGSSRQEKFDGIGFFFTTNKPGSFRFFLFS